MSQTTVVMPAEWALQDAILLTWPHAGTVHWRPRLDQVNRTFAGLATVISRYQMLIIACFDAAHRQQVQEMLAAAGASLERCRLHIAPSDDLWARDHGPITVYRDGRPVLVDFRFNGWGGKYPCELDNQLSTRLHEQGVFGDTPLEPLDLILEGGSIETDGRGALLTTAECLLNPNRNGLDRETMEQRLRDALGFSRFLWLQNGHLAGDDTDGHIDTLARFCDPRTIVWQGCSDPADPHFAPLQAMAEELRAFCTEDGEPYRLIELPLPAARYNENGQRLPAGYANFLVVNGAVLVPTYDDPLDAEALRRLQIGFPDREVVGVPSATLIYQYGSLHCVTMQLPAGVLKPG